MKSTRGYDGLSRVPRPSAGHQVRPEEPNDQGHDGEGKIAVDVLSMVEEVSVNDLVDDDDYQHDQQPHRPVRNEVMPHLRQYLVSLALRSPLR